MSAKITWLASYPKSGNTWFRIFLANLLADGEEPLSINALEFSSPIASSRSLFDRYVGLNSADLTVDEIRALQSDYTVELARHYTSDFYMKTHEGYHFDQSGKALHAISVTKAAIYFVRNPLDVCLSWANHSGCSMEESVQMLNGARWLAKGKRQLNHQLPQYLGSWSAHLSGWLDQYPGPLCVLRYEDLLETPLEQFTRAVQFLGLETREGLIEKAIAFSRFDELKAQEAALGFAEKPSRSRAFFHRGRRDAWRECLAPHQVAALTSTHGPMMRRLGYWSEEFAVC